MINGEDSLEDGLNMMAPLRHDYHRIEISGDEIAGVSSLHCCFNTVFPKAFNYNIISMHTTVHGCTLWEPPVYTNMF